MNLVWIAFGMGLISAISLPLGAISAFIWRFEPRVIAAMMAFGGGALLAALTIDLVAPTLLQGHYTQLLSGFMAGGLMFIGLNHLVNNFGGFRRKISTSVHQSHIETRRRLQRILSHLNRSPIFNGLSSEECRRLAAEVQPRYYPQGAQLFRRGDPSDAIYVVVRGEVEISDDSRREAGQAKFMERIGNGSAFGVDSLLTGSVHCYTATTLQPTWGWCIPEASVRRLLVTSSTFRQTICSWLRQPRIRNYLVKLQHMAEADADAWLQEAAATLAEEGRLPDARPVDRRSEAFRDFASQVDRLPWLEDLSGEEAEWLSLHLVYRHYQAGDVLFEEGSPADRLFILQDGGITLADSHENFLPSRYDAGDGVGVRAFITGVRHTVSARAVRECGAWSLRREDFIHLLANYPDIRHRLSAYLKTPVLSAYLRQRYQLDGGRIQEWTAHALKAVEAGKAPPTLLSQGVESSEPKGASTAIWLGILLDGVPESLVIGASLTSSGMSLSLIVGLFLANFPEALSSSRGMLEENFSRKRILLMWSSIALLTGVGAALGKLLIDTSNPTFLPFLEGLAAGAMLTMIAQTMLPEAYIKGGSLVGFWTMLGFLCAIGMKAL